MPVRRFLWEFLKSPKTIGAVAPSGKALGQRMLEGIDLATTGVVVEYGPGTGVFTEEILYGLRPGARYLGFEINDYMVEHLERRFPGATILQDSAANLRGQLREQGIDQVDVILSSLPWSVFPEELQDSILEETAETLRESGGTFSTFMYVHAQKLPGGVRLLGRLEHLFDRVERTSTAWLNVPPAFVYRCTQNRP